MKQPNKSLEQAKDKPATEENMQEKIALLSEVMTKGIRRWEKVIYPMMVGFILLAAYGFYLIVNLTEDMHKITENMAVMSQAVVSMDRTISVQLVSIDDKMQHIVNMSTYLQQMNDTLRNMNQSVYYMANTTGQMNSHISELNNNISQPLESFNTMMPWSMFSPDNNYQPGATVPSYSAPLYGQGYSQPPMLMQNN